MPYLDWKDAALHLEVTPHARLKTQLTLSLGGQEVRTLIALLEDIYLGEGGELRLALPENWVLFWKRRDEESRTLVAHPQSQEWVGTIALESDMGRKLLFSLKNLEEGQSLILSDLGLFGTMSNLELVISLRK